MTGRAGPPGATQAAGRPAPWSAGRLALAAGLAALVTWLSLTPKPPSPVGLPSNSDLVAHLAMHGALAWSLARACAPSRALAAGVLALAVGLETAQLLVPGRTFSAADLAMNLTGAALGLGVVALQRRRR